MGPAQTEEREALKGTYDGNQTQTNPHADPGADAYAHPDRTDRNAGRRIMLDAVLAFAVLCAGIAALTGSRTALALLAGTGLEMGLTAAGVPFNPPGWIAIDAVVALSILIPPRSLTDKLVVALFGPAWVFYYIDGQAGYAGSVVVCSAQMLLTFPLARAWRKAGQCASLNDLWRDFDLRVRHAP